MMKNEPNKEVKLPKNVVVSVENVSKSYQVWSSLSARRKFLFGNFVARFARFLPGRFRARLDTFLNECYELHHAVHDVDFHVKKGESWGIIGYNGSGKSTLLKMISGNLRPSRGQIIVDGKVAILDYSSGLNSEFTGKENIYLKGTMHGLNRQEVADRYDDIVNFADIGDFINQPVKIYSSGMLARLGFAIMAHVDADIIITDEALAVGDAVFVQKSMRFLRNFLKTGTFLFVSHSVNDVLSLCDNAVWLENGRVKAIGTSKDVVNSYLAAIAMVSEAPGDEFEEEILTGDDKNKCPTDKVDNMQDVDKNIPTSVVIKNTVDRRELRQPQLADKMHAIPTKKIIDGRLGFINRTSYRNDIKIAEFDMDVDHYGHGGVKIEHVSICDDNGDQFSWVVGGEMACLQILLSASANIKRPIVGFQFKDPRGQVIFADNTSLTTAENPISIPKGKKFKAEFVFQMPLLPHGEYSIRAAVATGTESEARMLDCVDNALILSCSPQGVRHGLVGLPMEKVSLELIGNRPSN